MNVPVRTVISPYGWKLSLFKGDNSQLFNLNDDPGETKNLFDSGRHKDVIDRLTEKIRQWHIAVQRNAMLPNLSCVPLRGGAGDARLPKKARCKMKKWFTRKIKKRVRQPVFCELNTHHWATKMETQHFIAGKPDLKLDMPQQCARAW